MDNFKQLSLDLGESNSIMADSTLQQSTAQHLTLLEKIEKSKNSLRLACDMSKEFYGKPLIITYSGGKDSDVLLHLAETTLNTDEFEVMNSHTTVDAPETVYHIREVFKRLEEKGVKTFIDYHKKDGNTITMWNLIPYKISPPTRLARYCCQILKETGTPNRLACLGVRRDESAKRRGRDTFGIRTSTYDKAQFYSLEHAQEVFKDAQEMQDPVWDCTLIKNMREHGDVVVNPIYEWSDCDVWDYIKQENIKTNPLYERGYKRVGCILCPMATYKQKKREMKDYPTYKQAYIHAFDEMLKEMRRRQNDPSYRGCKKEIRWKNGEDVFWWWIEEGKRNCKGQIGLFDENS